ncbi:hypothetical protein [uncultured Microbacterium sp.]|uniref:hypothetical protein n=1 Tax=uncultured Microbacterium sp. TaxID=191216 RepID=UPI0025D5ED2E|nr:hypothetical protein [uncultured Microbacterium sp.]
MNTYGRIVALLFSTGLLFITLAILRGRIDGAAALAAALLTFAVALTVWAAINRKRNHS